MITNNIIDTTYYQSLYQTDAFNVDTYIIISPFEYSIWSTSVEYPEISAQVEYATITTFYGIFYIRNSCRLYSWNPSYFTLTYAIGYPSSTASIFFTNETTFYYTRTSLCDYSIAETKIDNSTFVIFKLSKYYFDNLKVFSLLN